MSHKVYERPGVHAHATFEAAAQAAVRNGWHGAIMECPEGISTYGTGWHVISGDVQWYQSQGYILRAQIRIVVEEVGDD